MLLALQHAAELPPIVREELEQLIAGIQTAFNTIDITGAIQTATNASAIRRYTLAQAQAVALTASDAGVLAFISDYGHLLRWTGTAWEFAPGDPGNDFIAFFRVAPQQVGWKLCDGTATDLLTVGATLTNPAVTPPNLTGTPSYLKSAAAYTGTLVAAAITGKTAQVGDNGVDPDDMNIIGFNAAAGGTGVISSASLFKHKHSPGTLAADVAHVDMLPYYRR